MQEPYQKTFVIVSKDGTCQGTIVKFAWKGLLAQVQGSCTFSLASIPALVTQHAVGKHFGLPVLLKCSCFLARPKFQFQGRESRKTDLTRWCDLEIHPHHLSPGMFKKSFRASRSFAMSRWAWSSLEMLRHSAALPRWLARDLRCRVGSRQCGLQRLPSGHAASWWGVILGLRTVFHDNAGVAELPKWGESNSANVSQLTVEWFATDNALLGLVILWIATANKVKLIIEWQKDTQSWFMISCFVLFEWCIPHWSSGYNVVLILSSQRFIPRIWFVPSTWFLCGSGWTTNLQSTHFNLCSQGFGKGFGFNAPSCQKSNELSLQGTVIDIAITVSCRHSDHCVLNIGVFIFWRRSAACGARSVCRVQVGTTWQCLCWVHLACCYLRPCISSWRSLIRWVAPTLDSYWELHFAWVNWSHVRSSSVSLSRYRESPGESHSWVSSSSLESYLFRHSLSLWRRWVVLLASVWKWSSWFEH